MTRVRRPPPRPADVAWHALTPDAALERQGSLSSAA